MRLRTISAVTLAASLALPGALYAAGNFGGLPTTSAPLTGSELVPADTGLAGGASPQSEVISTDNLASYVGGFGIVNGFRNVLVGGDATTNLFQRATTGSSVTTTVTYGGPDRWAYWSGTGTAMTLSRDSTAGDLPAGAQYAFKMARTSGQTGVIQMCMAQEVESANSYNLAGKVVELDFHAITGANFSAAAANMTAYIISGTGSDEGMQKLAWGLNAGGGGSVGWTGQANATAAVISLGAVSTSGRYAAIATIPAAATEVGVALCYTPVGTASTNDYIAFDNIQLVKSPSNASLVSATVGYNAALIPAAAFERRPAVVETMLQQRYYYQLTESAAVTPVASCAAVDTTHTNCLIQFPVTMRAAPTATYANGFASPTTTSQATLGACTTLSNAATVATTTGNTNAFLVNCAATTIPAAGVASYLYSNNGTGAIKISAEF